MLKPGLPVRERILSIGAYGSGKSYAWLSIAQMVQATGSPGRFFVIDSDAAIQRMLATEFPDLDNVTIFPVFEFDQYQQAAATAQQAAGPDDWIVVDLLDMAWDAAQSYFISSIFEENMSDYFLQQRKGNSRNALDGWKDWSVINKMHAQFMNTIVHKSKANVYAAAKVNPIYDTEDDSIRAMFGAFGVKPGGQKHNGHAFHTVLLLSVIRPGEWKISTIKDRGREALINADLTNFASDYLLNQAGWELD